MRTIRMMAIVAAVVAAFAATFTAANGSTSGKPPEAASQADVAPSIVTDGDSTQASEDGCNWWTCIEGFRTQTNVVYIHARQAADQTGCGNVAAHFHLTGPSLNRDTESRTDCNWTKYYTGGKYGKFCAEGWHKIQGVWRSIGKPCITL